MLFNNIEHGIGRANGKLNGSLDYFISIILSANPYCCVLSIPFSPSPSLKLFISH